MSRDKDLFNRYLGSLHRRRPSVEPQKKLEDEKEKHLRRDKWWVLFKEFYYGPDRLPATGIVVPGTPDEVLLADERWRASVQLHMNSSEEDINKISSYLSKNVLQNKLHPLCQLIRKVINLFHATYSVHFINPQQRRSKKRSVSESVKSMFGMRQEDRTRDMSSKEAQRALHSAVKDTKQFISRCSKLMIKVFPELKSRMGRECCQQAVVETLLPQIYRVLFSLYRRRYFYRDAEFTSKLYALQKVTTRDLGVSERFALIDDPWTKFRQKERPSVEEAPFNLDDSTPSGHLSITKPPPNHVLSSSVPKSLPSTRRPPSVIQETVADSNESPPPRAASPFSTRIEFSQPVSRYKTQSFVARNGHPLGWNQHIPTSVSEATSYMPDSNSLLPDMYKKTLSASPRATVISESLSTFPHSPQLTTSRRHSFDNHDRPAVVSTTRPALLAPQNTPQAVPQKPDASHKIVGFTLSLEEHSNEGNKGHAEISSGPKANRRASLTESLRNLKMAEALKANEPNPACPYQKAIDEFLRITSVMTPREKLQAIVSSSSAICVCVDDYYESRGLKNPLTSDKMCIGADDLLSIFAYIVIKSKLGYAISEAAFIDDFATDALKLGKAGYFLATLQAAVELISGLDKDRVLNMAPATEPIHS